MELVVGLLVLAVILYLLFGGAGKKPNTAKPPYISEKEKILNENSGWMDERWALARKERDVGELRSVPRWFFDDVTEQQLQKIGEIGLKIGGGRPTKGEASDIIGLFEPVEVENIEILKFFKIPLKGMNQSRARHEVSKLFHNPGKLESWRNRPASPMQKEFYKFFALKTPQDLTHEVAARCINEYRKKLGQEDEAKMDE